jgi:thiol-disulfide isomerase/thioredoxin
VEDALIQRRFIIAAIVVAHFAALAAAGCSKDGAKTAEHAATTPATPADTAQLVPVTPAELASVIRTPGSKATLVNVWATWCQPCREEFPDLVKLQRAYRDRGLRLLFVSADFSEALPEAHVWLAQQGVDWRTYYKTGDDTQFIDSLDPRWSGALPGSFLYDSEGRLSRYWEGKADYATLEERVLSVLQPTAKPDSLEERS